MEPQHIHEDVHGNVPIKYAARRPPLNAARLPTHFRHVEGCR